MLREWLVEWGWFGLWMQRVPSVCADLVWDAGTVRRVDRIRRGAAGALTGVRSVHRLWIWKVSILDLRFCHDPCFVCRDSALIRWKQPFLRDVSPGCSFVFFFHLSCSFPPFSSPAVTKYRLLI
jgi:hypothetical protein